MLSPALNGFLPGAGRAYTLKRTRAMSPSAIG